MRAAQFVCLLLLAAAAFAQSNARSAPHGTGTVSSANLVFAEPDRNSPLQLPSTVMDGAPLCGPEGTAFIQFLTPPQRYNERVIFSISPRGKVVRYATEHISGLTDVSIVSFDPGVSMAVMLLTARTAGESRASQGYYLGLFNYDGELRDYSRLDLDFEPSKVAQIADDTFLIMGADKEAASARFEFIDGGGGVLRSLDPNAIVPTEQELKDMTAPIKVVGMRPEQFPSWMRARAALSLFRFVHSPSGLLIIEPGGGARIVKLLPSGETYLVKLSLPDNQIADSVIPSRNRWFVRTSESGAGNASNLYELDAESCKTLRRINTGGVPATSIACATASGFYGIRWIDHKPYVISADLR